MHELDDLVQKKYSKARSMAEHGKAQRFALLSYRCAAVRC